MTKLNVFRRDFLKTTIAGVASTAALDVMPRRQSAASYTRTAIQYHEPGADEYSLWPTIKSFTALRHPANTLQLRRRFGMLEIWAR